MSQVVLTYDLHGAQPPVYKKLNEELAKLNYVKKQEDTTWEGNFPSMTVRQALGATETNFATCASAAGAVKYNLRIYGSAQTVEIAVIKK